MRIRDIGGQLLSHGDRVIAKGDPLFKPLELKGFSAEGTVIEKPSSAVVFFRNKDKNLCETLRLTPYRAKRYYERKA
ncbi:MAG: hypothetical protein IJ668_05625 [Selenomonadaceae bacterium]|nr:hypothetical protein [Selenomonadaceae bacterium]